MSTLNPRAERLNRLLEPLVGLAVLATIPLVVLGDHLDSTVALSVNTGVWAVFTGRFLTVLAACSNSEERRSWVSRSKLDLVIIAVTFPTLPSSLASLRILGASSVLALFRLLQLGRLLLFGWVYDWLHREFHESPVIFSGAVAAIAVLVGANVMHLLEPGLVPNLTTALWFTFTTCSTVGYGDIVPQTLAGRFVGLLLMVIGVATMAAFSGALASYLTSGKDREGYQGLDDVIRELREVKLHLARLEALQLAARDGPQAPSGPSLEPPPL